MKVEDSNKSNEKNKMKKILLISLTILLTYSIVLAQTTRGIKVVTKDKISGLEEELKLYDNMYALIIGIDNYSKLSFHQQLQYAVSDAKAVVRTLSDKFAFSDIKTLYNERATRENILKTISEFRTTGEEDAIFIFFASHGWTESTPDGELGYLIPTDGSLKPEEMYLNISMSQLKELLKPIPAKHIFVVVDACYSGTLLVTRGLESEPAIDLAYFKEITRGRVRQVLTAGGKGQEVMDGGPGGHSVFTGYFLRFLEKADSYITAKQLGFKVPEQVYMVARERGHTQIPQFGNLIGEGDFVFILKRVPKLFGKLIVSTIPQKAELYLNESLIGYTPIEIDELKPGKHKIRAESEDYFYTGEVEIEPGKIRELNIKMERKAVSNENISPISKPPQLPISYLPLKTRKSFYFSGEIGIAILDGDFQDEDWWGFENIWKPGIGGSGLIGFRFIENLSIEGEFSGYAHLPDGSKNKIIVTDLYGNIIDEIEFYNSAVYWGIILSAKFTIPLTDNVNFFLSAGGGRKWFIWSYSEDMWEYFDVEDDGLTGIAFSLGAGADICLSDNIVFSGNISYNIHSWSNELYISGNKIEEFKGNALEITLGGRLYF